MDPLDILIRYRKVRRHRDFDLRKFVENHFWLPEVYSSEYVSDPQNSLKEHIDQLWPVLTREPQDHIPWSSLLALPQSYIVPGGRFSETYYWDSYFTMLGLAESGREDLLKCMADNFALDDRKLRPHPQRQPHLLFEPLATTGFCADGGVV